MIASHPDDAWLAYTDALGLLHARRDGAVQAHRGAVRAAADRERELEVLGARLIEQQQALGELAVRLRVPIGSGAPAPGALPPQAVPPAHETLWGGGGAGADLADLRARVDGADAALAEARRVAGLPQLLPSWTTSFARAAVVYSVFAIPSLILTVLLSLAGVRDSRAVLVWFAIVWPTVTALAGGLFVRWAERPRLDGGALVTTGTAAGQRGRPQQYRWFGILIAWASWLVPGILLDWVGSLWPG